MYLSRFGIAKQARPFPWNLVLPAMLDSGVQPMCASANLARVVRLEARFGSLRAALNPQRVRFKVGAPLLALVLEANPVRVAVWKRAGLDQAVIARFRLARLRSASVTELR